jgi:hypothetical protein
MGALTIEEEPCQCAACRAFAMATSKNNDDPTSIQEPQEKEHIPAAGDYIVINGGDDLIRGGAHASTSTAFNGLGINNGTATVEIRGVNVMPCELLLLFFYYVFI